jgi:hypothetical protein
MAKRKISTPPGLQLDSPVVQPCRLVIMLKELLGFAVDTPIVYFITIYLVSFTLI